VESQDVRRATVKHLAFVLTSWLLGSSLCTLSARADPRAAEALFEEGVRLADRGAFAQACVKFEASEALDVAVGTLLRLADCYERTGRLASAWSRFREAASLAQVQAMPEREHIANVRANALEPKMARLTISVPPRPPSGYSLQLDGTVVPPGSWGTALPVDPGTLTVEASAPGYLTFIRKISVSPSPGVRTELQVPLLEPEPRPLPAPSPLQAPAEPASALPASALGAASDRGRTASDRGYAARVLGATFGVVGGASLATGGVLAVLAAKRNDHSLDYCGKDPRFCTPRGVQLRREAGSLADAATLSAAAGGVLLVTGFVVYTAAPSGHSAERVSVSATPQVAAKGVTLQLRGAF
jgi:hypothetical protein